MKQSSKELKHQNDLRRIFIKELDEDELLLKDYSCTYHKDIIIRGRLYITSHMLCFHSSMLGWGNQLTISFGDITSILKRRIVLLLPNALAICANGKKFVFSSFKNRNQAFNHLFKVWQNVLMNSPLSPEALYAQINGNGGNNTSLAVNDSNSMIGKTTHAAGTLKENESDSSNDSLARQATKGIASTNGNNSDEASGYFTEERVNTSVEDVSRLVIPPATVEYLTSSSQTDSDICDSDSNLELKLGLIDDPAMNTGKIKLKTSTFAEIPENNRLDNAIKPTHTNKLSTSLGKQLQKHCTTPNMLNLLMIFMICLVIFTTGLLLCELSAVDPDVNEMLSWLPGLSRWCHPQHNHTPDDLREQLEVVHQLSTDLRTLLLEHFIKT